MNAFGEAPSPAPAPAGEARHLAAAAAAAGVAVTHVALPRHEHVVLGGMRLHHLDRGSPGGGRGTPGGLPVVFLHGGGLNAHTWDIVCLALREEHRCYAVDLRGHRDSEWSPVLDYGLGAHLRDLEAVADHLGAARFFLAGQSLGGIIGIGYASRHPRRLAGLVAVDSGPFAGSQARIDRLAAFTLDSREFASLDEAPTRALALNPRRDPRLLRYSLQHNMRRLPGGRRTWKRGQRHLSRQRMAALVAQIRALAPLPHREGSCPRRLRCGRYRPGQGECAFMTAKSTTPAALTWSGVTARRMARHALAQPATDLGPAGIAGVLCGAHAQVLSAAELPPGGRARIRLHQMKSLRLPQWPWALDVS